MLSSARLIVGFRKPWQILALLVLAWCGVALWAGAQQPGLLPPASTVQPPAKHPQLPPMPQREPRPDKGPDAVNAFVKDLTNTDSIFEVFIGQSRIMTLKEDLAELKKKGEKQAKGDALITVGDATIVDFAVLSARQLRISGLRLGVTDFSITTGDNRTYTFEVRVVADVHVLNGQLARLFPDAKNLKVGQIRDHLVVEGEATHGDQRNRILETIRSYLDSIKGSQFQGKRENATQPPLPETYVINLIRVVSAVERENQRKVIQEKDKNEMKDLEDQLRTLFPDATLRLSKINYDIAVAGQARDATQVGMILKTIESYLVTYRLNFVTKQTSDAAEALKGRSQKEFIKEFNPVRLGEKDRTTDVGPGSPNAPSASVNIGGAQTPLQSLLQNAPPSKVINLIRIPGPQQVLLKVRVAELNRTSLRQIGADMTFSNPNGSSVIGTKIGGPGVAASSGVNGKFPPNTLTLDKLLAAATNTTAFGIFDKNFDIMLNALRKNDLLKILAEPNLVAMNGHDASFLAGGKFAYPVPSSFGQPPSVQFQEFGVQLGFKPYILDGGVIRLKVDPVVSTIDFTLGTTIQGTAVPGLNSREAHTTVELREGETLAVAGLLSVTLEGSSGRIPGLGDLPVLGVFFSNTSSKRTEKELIVLVTPYVVDAMCPDQVPPAPGSEVNGPNDLEFYLCNRIEGRHRDFRGTTGHYTTAPAVLPTFLRLHDEYVRGPHGFSD